MTDDRRPDLKAIAESLGRKRADWRDTADLILYARRLEDAARRALSYRSYENGLPCPYCSYMYAAMGGVDQPHEARCPLGDMSEAIYGTRFPPLGEDA